MAASNYGQSSHPAWYYNLRADPRATVEFARADITVTARELSGHEHHTWFERAVRMYPPFRTYQQRARQRHIPVLRLDPI
jgi:F420H(2)-dependent quinone reductase